MQPRILLNRDFSFDSIQVRFNSHPQWQVEPQQQKEFDQRWEEKLADFKARGIAVWDGDFYRLDNITELMSVKNDDPITLKLSIVKYRYVNTIRDFADYYEIHPENYPNHVSVGAIIKTSDSKWVFGLRGKSNIHSNDVDLIGGGLHQNELEINSGHDIYRNLLKEFQEEIGVKESQIAKCEGIGIVQSAVSNVLLIAQVSLKLTANELVEVFSCRTEDEMSDLVFVEGSKISEYLSQMTSYRTLIPELLK